jgi:hypothetical protein
VVAHLLRVVSAQKDSRNERTEAVERLHDQLQTSLRELVTSEDWQRALAVAARFHDYSFANSRLIWAQSLARGITPSRVAGYRMWQQLGRQVRRGEHGLQILAPVIVKVTPQNGNEEERRVVGFRVVRVFDIAQTDGEPLPEVTAVLVEGDLPSQWERVGELIIGAGFGLQVADLDRLGDVKSRRYSTTLGALRSARAQWSANRPDSTPQVPESDAVKDWRYLGRGRDNPGDEWLARTAATATAEARKLTRKARLAEREG